MNQSGGQDDPDEYPATVGLCTKCGRAYVLQSSVDGKLIPAGNDGTCTCGNEEFEEAE